MLAYVIRRVLYVIPVVLGVALITFTLFHIVGAETAPALILGKNATPQAITELKKQLGLWGPLFLNWDAWRESGSVPALFDSQFGHYLKQIVTFDFGRSWATQQKISTLILAGVLPSLSLTVPIFVIDLLLAIAIALVAAFYRNTWLDRSIVVLAVMGMSVSYLVYILLGQYLLAYRLELFPIWGYEAVRYLVSFLPRNNMEMPPFYAPSDRPDRLDDSLDGMIPDSANQPYDMTKVVETVLDSEEFFEVHRQWAQNIIIGFGRLDGHAVGVVANQPSVLAGTLDITASEKAARFVRF